MEKAIGSSAANQALALPRDFRQAYLATGLFAAYILCDLLTGHFPGRFGITPFNPHAAIAIALLMFCGMKYLPLVIFAAAVGEFVIVSIPRPPGVALAVTIILTAGYATVAAFLTNQLRINLDLDTRRDVVHLIVVTLFCMLFCGMAYVAVLMYFDIGGGGRYFHSTRRFFIGYSVGVLVVAPVIFMVLRARRRHQIAAFFRSGEGKLQIVAIAACVSWVFLQEEPAHVQNFYVLFLPLIWAATRFGMVGAALALALIQLGVYLVFYLTAYKPLSVFELQLLMIALVITGLLLGVTSDEQRRASDDFRESLRLAAAGEMAAAIAHEINQPLTALSGYATAGQLIAAAPNPDRAQLIGTMNKLLAESKRTAAVVQRLRDFFRSGATRLEPVAIGDLIVKVTQRLRASADAANITLTHYAPATIPPVLVDTLQMEVVLRNLIMNAIESAADANTPGGRVGVRVETNPAGEVVVMVRDSGTGVPHADTGLLFDSFMTTKSSGMGMGLAISRAIIDAHGGRIWAVPGSSGLVCFALPPDVLTAAGRS